MVAELFAHTVGVVKNGPFLPNYSGPIRVKNAEIMANCKQETEDH